MKGKKTREFRELQLKVVRLCDDFALFSEQCAFLCDAFAAVSAQQELVTPQTVGGMYFYSHWLKSRVLELKRDLYSVHEQLRSL